MLFKDYLTSLKQINIPQHSPEYIHQSAAILANHSSIPIVELDQNPNEQSHTLTLASLDQIKDSEQFSILPDKLPERFIWVQIDQNQAGKIICSHAYYFYSFCHHLLDHSSDLHLDNLEQGTVFKPSFGWNRTAYDYYLTQEGRICRGRDRETYIREMAKNGFTHLEVNGLAYPMGLENGPKGETYPMFYTYCPALDQFVYSELNKGLYPFYYLEANLNYLRENARLAVKYGLVPGLLCFEPRSVPEQFFDKYPMLRGARIDHPFRSFRPRYNMTITHPKVRAHYAEMMRKLMQEVPELGFLNIWTNDSGAGFEHTKSLYVGRNGGAYLIREWKDDDEIAKLAGDNALRFFKTLRDAGKETNPDFRVITRMESFYGEHDVMINGFRDQLDIETSSLVQRGWQMPYHHPLYRDQFDINAGSVYQRDFSPNEKDHIDFLDKRNSRTSIYFGYGPQVMFAPLIGIPYPRLTLERLQQLNENGIRYLSHMGGSVPPELAPYNINQQLLNSFQFNPELCIDKYLHHYALEHAGEKDAVKLLSAWDLTEKAILAFPNVSALYSTIGFSWYRLWTRPLVPDIEAIPQNERDYYEDFMCTTPHNPNNVDLSRDVLFQLLTPEKSKKLVASIDRNVWTHLQQAIELLEDATDGILYDQLIRIKALRCWINTQRNVASWVELVHGYMEADKDDMKEDFRSALKETIKSEITNSRALIELLDSSVEFMALTDQGETPLVYGTNMKELLERRIDLMKKHIDDQPFIDHNYIERKAGEPIY